MKLVFFWQGENNSKSVNCIVVMPLLQKTQSQIQMSLLDVTVQCFDEIFTIHFFWREIQIPHLLEKFKKCQLKLLCRYYTEPNTNFFIKCNGTQCFDEIFTINFFSAGNSNSSL